MRKVLRGYAKDKHGNLILIGTTPVLFSKDKCSPATREGKSGKAQRSLRKKRFVNRPRSDTRRNLVGTLVVCDNFIGPAMGGGR